MFRVDQCARWSPLTLAVSAERTQRQRATAVVVVAMVVVVVSSPSNLCLIVVFQCVAVGSQKIDFNRPQFPNWNVSNSIG